jgi:hypothetical protein
MNASKSLAEQAQGRIISAHIDVKLTPPKAALGETDAASEIGSNLIHGALHLLQQAAEKNGFHVEIKTVQVVY